MTNFVRAESPGGKGKVQIEMSWSVFNHWLWRETWSGRWNAAFYSVNTPTVLVSRYQCDITGCRAGRDTIGFHFSVLGTGQEPTQEKRGSISQSFCTLTTERKKVIQNQVHSWSLVQVWSLRKWVICSLCDAISSWELGRSTLCLCGNSFDFFHSKKCSWEIYQGNIWVVSSLGLWWIKWLWAFLYKSFL